MNIQVAERMLEGKFVAFVPKDPAKYGLNINQPFLVGKVLGLNEIADVEKGRAPGGGAGESNWKVMLQTYSASTSKGQTMKIHIFPPTIPVYVNDEMKKHKRPLTVNETEEAKDKWGRGGKSVSWQKATNWFWHPTSDLLKVTGFLRVSGSVKGKYMTMTAVKNLLEEKAGGRSLADTVCGDLLARILRGERPDTISEVEVSADGLADDDESGTSGGELSDDGGVVDVYGVTDDENEGIGTNRVQKSASGSEGKEQQSHVVNDTFGDRVDLGHDVFDSDDEN